MTPTTPGPHPSDQDYATSTGPADRTPVLYPLRDSDAWARQWAAVPDPWRAGTYRIDAKPASSVFTQNANYEPGRTFNFRPGGPPRLGDELAWWIDTCWAEGLRKIEPSMLRWWSEAVTSLAAARTTLNMPPASLADLPPAEVTREALHLIYRRNKRMPSPGNTRNLTSISKHIHLLISARTTNAPWWQAPAWSLLADNRIPRRPHEPVAGQNVHIQDIQPAWLREGLRFYLSRALIHDTFTWTTLTTRARVLDAYFGRYLMTRAVATPAPHHDDPVALRALFTDLASWLRSPEATRTGKPLTPNTISASQGAIQSFYDYMYDNVADAAAFSGDHRWAQLGPEFLRLWPPDIRTRASRRSSQPDTERYITPADLSMMAACIPLLAAPTDQEVTIELPGGRTITHHGLGDPQAANAWLLQAATGRRASEILMLDFRPLTPIPGITSQGTSDTNDPNAFVARLRYQQTKVDGADPTILVEQYVVDLVRRQQDWTRARLELSDHEPEPPYLFISPRQNYRGIKPRSYGSVSRSLHRLNTITNLRDEHGNPLRFTTTHRLRHTRATTLLNAGVPIHVVQDYLGHRSPEMTMHYARTLAKVAEAEFIKAAATGAFGNPLPLDRADAYAIAQMEGRTDRILPNGLCMLYPTQSCDKGNACLTCTAFATDATHLAEFHAQRDQTRKLIDLRQETVTARHGRPMPDNNVWLAARHRELNSLNRIIDALTHARDDDAPGCPRTISGAGSDRRDTPARRSP